MTKIIAGNWKMNLNLQESLNLLQKIVHLSNTNHNSTEVIIAPNYLAVDRLSHFLQEQKNRNIKMCVQDIHWEVEGAYTGKVAVSMLKGLNVSFSLVGHSEQRIYFGETDEIVNKKIQALLKNNITPILCIGEILKEREQDQFQEVITKQLKNATTGLEREQIKNLIVAYEPVWSIGTGVVASSEQIEDVHQIIKKELSTLCGSEMLGYQIKVLYGGSVKPKNAKQIMEIKNVDGVLVGGASLKAEDFTDIIKSA